MNSKDSPKIKSIVKAVISEYETQLPCRVDTQTYTEHCKTLDSLKTRTIRIEAMAATTIVLITIFGILIGMLEYSKKKEAQESSEKNNLTIKNIDLVQVRTAN